MSDTPETDRFYVSFADGEAIPSQAEWLDLCRKLERKMNEARRQAEIWRDNFKPGMRFPIEEPMILFPWEKGGVRE